MADKQKPTFTVKFTGKDISLETVSLRVVTEAISSIQRLAIGATFEETRKAEDTIHLVGVKRGSAVFKCYTNIPGVIEGLQRAQRSIESSNDKDFDYTLRPVEILSEISKRLECQILVQLPDKSTIIDFNSSSYERISEGMVSVGDTTIFGTLTRVGGSTRNHCAIRLVGRKRLLYCKVADQKLARKLGRWLYRSIALKGQATWIGRSGFISSFKVIDAYQPKLIATDDMLEALREAGGSDWDGVADVAELLSRD